MSPGDIVTWRCQRFPDVIHRWKVVGVYLGGEKQESLVELKTLTHRAGEIEGEGNRVLVPEVLLRGLEILRREDFGILEGKIVQVNYAD